MAGYPYSTETSASAVLEPGVYLLAVDWVGQLAAGAYGHNFTSTLRRDDALLLFDSDASPALLWSVEIGGVRLSSAEGPHRPLAVGTEVVGAHAAPRAGTQGLYWIRRGASGNTVMRMR